MRTFFPRPRYPRRGVTLLEMLVAVALLVLMMTVIVSIFQAATGAVTTQRAYQELDGELRQLDSVLRQDLTGATARFTPPLDPDLQLGYFEVGENQWADLQGEDGDDYLRFTSKAPEGQFFTGRMWVGPVYLPSPPYPANTPNQPITITSQHAEIIYFLRNGNLYRRVFLIAPERQSAVVINLAAANPWQFPAPTALGGTTVSWQGMNDLSARPASAPDWSSVVSGTMPTPPPPILNTLGDLTNRENRAFSPRFSNDYLLNQFQNSLVGAQLGLGNGAPDGRWDDLNPLDPTTNPAVNNGSPTYHTGDAVPDWWPTLYPSVFAYSYALINANSTPGLIDQNAIFPRQPNSTYANTDYPDLMSFPYVFPGAYSQPDGSSLNAGILHGLGATGAPVINGQVNNNLPKPFPGPYGYFYANGTAYPIAIPTVLANQNPLTVGDTLTTPDMLTPPPLQTWWAFPTWKETASPNWADPVLPMYLNSYQQTPPLSWSYTAANGLPLPPLSGAPSAPLPAIFSGGLVPLEYQPFNDGLGTTNLLTPNTFFRDDLIMQGVRSFDVKVYDNSVPGYVDLGYTNLVNGVPTTITPPNGLNQLQFAQLILGTMGHEGRMPPLPTDYRADPNFSQQTPYYWTSLFPGGVGDPTPGITRLRRVWDSWSTDYSQAPASGKTPSFNDPNNPPPPGTFLLLGPPFSPPVYPSYPPPYPLPLRGIQIQVRVVDPRNERIKVLTIRQDFSDKL